MEDNKKTLSLSVFQHKDIDMDASNYANELDRISEQSGVFKQYDLDPFKNPFLVTSFGHADEKMSYNKKIERYRNELFLKNKRKYKSKLLCKRFCPLQLIISNNGSAPCGKMNISISFSLPCVYPSTLMKKNINSCICKPKHPNENNNNNHIIYDVVSSGEKYEYYELENVAPITSPVCISVSGLLQKEALKCSNLLFYVDTTDYVELVISWEIVEEKLGASSKKGELKVTVK